MQNQSESVYNQLSDQILVLSYSYILCQYYLIHVERNTIYKPSQLILPVIRTTYYI